MRAVTQLPTPQNKQELLRFMEVIQYLSKFIPQVSDMSAPLRKLLEGETEWHWEKNAPTLKYYDVNEPVTLSGNAHSEGAGAIIL